MEKIPSCSSLVDKNCHPTTTYRYQYCRNAHRSTKSELHFIASTMFRKDRDLILDRAEALKKTSSLKTNFGDLMMPPTKEQMSKPGGAASNSD